MLTADDVEDEVMIDGCRQRYVEMPSSVSNVSLLLALFSVALDANFVILREISSYTLAFM